MRTCDCTSCPHQGAILEPFAQPVGKKEWKNLRKKFCTSWQIGSLDLQLSSKSSQLEVFGGVKVTLVVIRSIEKEFGTYYPSKVQHIYLDFISQSCVCGSSAADG